MSYKDIAVYKSTRIVILIFSVEEHIMSAEGDCCAAIPQNDCMTNIDLLLSDITLKRSGSWRNCCWNIIRN